MQYDNPQWLFKSPGPIPDGVVTECLELIQTMAGQAQDSHQEVLEDFKSYFSNGKNTTWSSNAGWAQTDLYLYMTDAATNAPRFIGAFVDGCIQLTKDGKAAPDTDFINEMLAKHGTGYQVANGIVVASTEPLVDIDDVPVLVDKPKAAFAKKPAHSATKLRVFLCHSSQDQVAVRDIYKMLRLDGFEPWLDEEDLIPGQEWDASIKATVTNTHVVVVCLSKTSINKAGYAQKEIVIALDVADQQPEGTIFIIPARLQECQVPKRLGKFHWVNLFEPDGYDKLVKSLKLRAGDLK